MIDIDIICEADFFSGFSRSEVEALMSKVRYSVKKYSKDEVIVHEGDFISSANFVHRGTVRTFFNTMNGREVSVNVIESPSAISQASIFADGARYPVSAVAQEEVTVISIPIEEMRSVLMDSPKVLMNFLMYFSEKNVELNQRLRVLLIKTIPQKLAYYILKLSGDRLDTVKLAMTQTELADFLSVTRPSLARGLRQLAEQGLIQYKTRTIKIINRDGLVDLLDD